MCFCFLEGGPKPLRSGGGGSTNRELNLAPPEAQPDGRTAAAATACFAMLESMIFVSDSTSQHWDVDFDGTTVDLSTDGRIQARGIPCGPGEALGPVRRAIPGRRVASEGYALFCIDFRYNVSIFVTCVSNRFRHHPPRCWPMHVDGGGFVIKIYVIIVYSIYILGIF